MSSDYQIFKKMGELEAKVAHEREARIAMEDEVNRLQSQLDAQR